MSQAKTLKRFDAFSTLINVLMGTGPILLPPVVAGAGVLLSSGMLLIMAVLSIIGAEFIIEALSIANCMKAYGTEEAGVKSKLVNDADTVSQIVSASEIGPPKPFEMNETIEIGVIASMLWGKKG